MLPTLTFQMKARASDRTVGGKVELKIWGRSKRGRERGTTGRRKWKEDGAEACGMEKPQVIWDLMDGK